MDYVKLKHLKVKEKVMINFEEYIVQKVERGIRVTGTYNEFLLTNPKGEQFFMKVIPDVAVKLWKLEMDPTAGKPVFSEKNEVKIDSIEC